MRGSRAILSLLIAVLGYCSVALVYGRLSCVLVSFGLNLVLHAGRPTKADGLLRSSRRAASTRPHTHVVSGGSSYPHPASRYPTMSNNDIDAQHTTSDILVPSLADGTPIIWDGNDAHIEGTLFDVGKYYLRVGLF